MLQARTYSQAQLDGQHFINQDILHLFPKIKPSNDWVQVPSATDVKVALSEVPIDTIKEVHPILMQAQLEDDAQYYGNFVTSTDEEQLLADYEAYLQKLIDDNNLSNEEYTSFINNRAVPVFTGHPTQHKTLSQESAHIERFNFLSGNKKFGEDTKEKLAATASDIYKKPDLPTEKAFGDKVLLNTRRARRLKEMVHIRVARKNFPKTYKQYTYSSGVSGTWYEVDNDGREDIPSAQALASIAGNKILEVENFTIPEYESLKEMLKGYANTRPLTSKIKKLNKTLKIEKDIYKELHQYKVEEDVDDIEGNTGYIKAQEIDKIFYDTLDDRITSKNELLELVDQYLGTPNLPEDAYDYLIYLKGGLETRSLSIAQSHARFNASRANTALRDEGFDIDASNENWLSHDDLFLPKLKEMIASVDLDNITEANFLSLAINEKSIAQQVLKHGLAKKYIDEDNISYQLIADTKNKLVPMAVLYFAAKLGVLDSINLMPLVEEVDGIENALEIFKGLGKDKFFRDDVAVKGVIASLKGLSDSTRQHGLGSILYQGRNGVYFSQTTKNYYPKNVTKVEYFCGGSASGRARHMGSHKKSLEYSIPSHLLHYDKKEGLLNRSLYMISYQGQGGASIFGTTESALSCLIDYTMYVIADHSASEKDLLYKKNKETLAIAEVMKGRTHSLQANPLFHECLDIFKNYNVSNGSRPVNHAVRKLMRAIQQNNTTLSIGADAITILYALNTARKVYPEAFDNLMRQSKDFRLMIETVDIALDRTNTETLRAYIENLNPKTYYDRARRVQDVKDRTIYRNIAKKLDTLGYYANFSGIFEDISFEIDEFRSYRDTYNDVFPPHEGSAYKPSLRRDFNVNVAHGIRLDMQQRAYFKGFSIPPYGQKEPNREDLLTGIIRGEMQPLAELEKIFGAKKRKVKIIDPRFEATVMQAANDNFSYDAQKELIEELKEINKIQKQMSCVLNNTPGGMG